MTQWCHCPLHHGNQLLATCGSFTTVANRMRGRITEQHRDSGTTKPSQATEDSARALIEVTLPAAGAHSPRSSASVLPVATCTQYFQPFME